MLVDIVKVTPIPDFTLEFEYANGETRCFDAKPLLTIKPWIALNSCCLLYTSPSPRD